MREHNGAGSMLLSIRLSSEDHERLARAAAVKGVSLASFIVDAAVEASRQVLAKPRLVFSSEVGGYDDNGRDT